MGTKQRRGAAPQGDSASKFELLPGGLDAKTIDLRRGAQVISTSREAVQAMLDAGAVFAVRQRDDSLGISFTYSVSPGGDRERARAVLAEVKARPPAFLAAFQCLVQQVAGERDVDQ